MDWVWDLYEEYVRKTFERAGNEAPTEEALEARFIEILSRSTVTVLVQEPWKNSVRFKGLARFDAVDAFDLFEDPKGFLRERYGGGKFKLNFHDGWHFVATQNFKPDGSPDWKEMPEVSF